jgi:hypothetical protein
MNIRLTVHLPPETEERLRAENPDLAAAVREGFLVNLFRRGMLTRAELGHALGLDRFETGALLKRHQIFMDPSHEELDAEVEAMRQLLERAGHDQGEDINRE